MLSFHKELSLKFSHKLYYTTQSVAKEAQNEEKMNGNVSRETFLREREEDC